MIRQMISVVLVLTGLCVVALLVLVSVRWVRQACLSRIQTQLGELEKDLWREVRADPEHGRTAASLLAHVRLLQHRSLKFTDGEKSLRPLREELQALLEDIENYHAGLDVYADKRGPIIKGYLSSIDRTLQTYSVNVPRGYLGDRPFPLVVHLHGHGWFAPFQGHPAPEYGGAITLAPYGRGPTDYLYIGEVDVLRTIEEVKKDYLIDEDRVYLTGTSMGGTGCWTLAVHHPHLFAGIAPRAGNADYRAWQSRWQWDPPE